MFSLYLNSHFSVYLAPNHLCIFGSKGAIQICYYYYYYIPHESSQQLLFSSSSGCSAVLVSIQCMIVFFTKTNHNFMFGTVIQSRFMLKERRNIHKIYLLFSDRQAFTIPYSFIVLLRRAHNSKYREQSILFHFLSDLVLSYFL